jgi:hypothetical protein
MKTNVFDWLLPLIVFFSMLGYLLSLLGGDSNIIIVKNREILQKAKELSYYLPIPNKDSSMVILIVGDSSAKIVKYPDSTMKITINKEIIYYFEKLSDIK